MHGGQDGERLKVSCTRGETQRLFITLAQECDALKQRVAAATPREPPDARGVGEEQGKDASMHVASFVKVAFASFLSDQVKPAQEESSSEPIPAPSRALPLRSNLVQLQKDDGRFERDAAARESERYEAAEVHADVLAALAAATLKIEELESQLLLQHERAEAYDGRDIAVHAAVHAAPLHAAAPTTAAAQTATHQSHGLDNVAEATELVRDAVMPWCENPSAKSTSRIASGRRDGDDRDDAALTSAVTESAVAEGYKQSQKESYNVDAPQACVEKDVWSDIWMFDQVSSPTGILHVRSLTVSDRVLRGCVGLHPDFQPSPPYSRILGSRYLCMPVVASGALAQILTNKS